MSTHVNALDAMKLAEHNLNALGVRGNAAEVSHAHAVFAQLAEAAGAGLADLLAMVAAADRGEVWVVNAGTRLRVEALQSALARVEG